MNSHIEVYIPTDFVPDDNHIIAKAHLTDNRWQLEEIRNLILETFHPMRLTITIDLHWIEDMEDFLGDLDELDEIASEKGILIMLHIICLCDEVCKKNYGRLIYSVRWRSRWN